MVMTRVDDAPIVAPEQVGALLVQPIADASTAIACSTSVATDSSVYRIPKVVEDPAAGWVAEGAEIPASDAQVAQLDVVPTKLAALTVITSELAADSDPSATAIITAGLARDIAKKIDAAYFGNLPAPAQSGLGALAGVTTVTAAGPAWTDLDVFAEAQSEAEVLGTTIDSFAANPADALALSTLRDEANSNRPLLGTDPSTPTRRVVFGVPLRVSQYVPAGTVWAIPRSRSFVVTRQGVEVTISSDAYFSSDRVGIRALTRVGFGFPQPAALVRIVLGA